MASPFPGMDPWLEEPNVWGGVHLGLIVAISTELNRLLPEDLVAGIEEYVWVRDTEDDDSLVLRKPDVFVPAGRTRKRAGVVLTPTATAPSVRGTLPKSEKRKQRVIRITTARGEQVLTVLELLSPKNKGTGDGRDAYIQKRREYLASVNLVEIDLLRGGNRFPMGRPAPPAADYYVFSCRRSDYPATESWPFSVRDSLPVVPVPLSQKYPDVPLDLRAALDRVYAEGRYANRIDYDTPPVPPLRADDAEWATELLKKRARKKRQDTL